MLSNDEFADEEFGENVEIIDSENEMQVDEVEDKDEEYGGEEEEEGEDQGLALDRKLHDIVSNNCIVKI